MFNWLPSLGCLATGVIGLFAGMNQASKVSAGGGLYLLAGAVGFGLFVWISRQPSD